MASPPLGKSNVLTLHQASSDPQRGAARRDCAVGVEGPAPHRVSIGLSSRTDRDGNLSSLSDPTLRRLLALLQSLQDSRLASPFSLCWHHNRWGRRFSCSLCLEQNHYFLHISCLAKLPLAWSFHWRADF